MARLSSTIAQLAKFRAMALAGAADPVHDKLRDLSAFGPNPGALKAHYHVPDTMPDNAPLVVVLHGCTQTAGGFDHGSGWSQLADEMGFALLFPEQQRSNNPSLCFNWFSAGDARRDSGEAASIRQMIAAMVANHSIDEARIFVTGLSAGGAMTSIMLASYPDIFAGGAIIAGLPFGCATTVGDAFARMRGEGYPSDAHLATLVRDASPHDGPWPTISIWQGSADATVAPSNAERILAQWQGVHHVEKVVPERVTIDGSPCRIWRDRNGRAVIEAYEIIGMGHGTPLAAGGPDGCGTPAPYMLEVGISSTRHIARSWGLDTHMAQRRPIPSGTASVAPKSQSVFAKVTPFPSARPAAAPVPPTTGMPKSSGGVGAMIEDALRKAGLMR